MRFKVEITDMNDAQWRAAQTLLKTSYDLPEGAGRMCLTLIHGEEERHVEAPATVLTGLTLTLAMAPVAEALQRNMEQFKKSPWFTPSEVAMAALTPDDPELPNELGPRWNQEYQDRTGDRVTCRCPDKCGHK